MENCLENCSNYLGNMGSGKKCGLISTCIGLIMITVIFSLSPLEGVEPNQYALL